MRSISEQELKDILDKHGKWLRSEKDGERANLRSADLRHANLRHADLRSADLRHADLRSADLRHANLRHADLRHADLRHADLSHADLRHADLSHADLRHADLSHANLSYAIGFKFLPLQIINTKYFITIFDDHVTWGCRKMTFDELKAFKFKSCWSNWEEDEFKSNKKIITEMIRYYRKAAT